MHFSICPKNKQAQYIPVPSFEPEPSSVTDPGLAPKNGHIYIYVMHNTNS